MLRDRLRSWTFIGPLIGWLLLAATPWLAHPAFKLALAAALIACVLAAVHHAESVAHRVGEPFGTLVLALAVTVIEASLIVSMMLTGGAAAATLARDTVFAAIMIILNGMVGFFLLVGGSRHGEQAFTLYGVNAALAALATLSVLVLVLPNTTLTTPGPIYSASQLIIIGAACLVLYGAFVLIQTVRHRDYFLPQGEAAHDAKTHAPPPSNAAAAFSAVMLLVSLGAVVLLAKKLSPMVEAAVESAGAPEALVGIIIAVIVLLPESLAALNAARVNRLQTSLNLALGSALATIGLTIPVVIVIALSTGLTLILGLDFKGTVLLALTLLVSALSLGTGRTTVFQGVVHLVIFAVYLFTTVVP
jgi:Ca2+:H+ antiporter